jgi:hypothetical protein
LNLCLINLSFSTLKFQEEESNFCHIDKKGKGKSGGARVITYVYIQTETIYLLTIYDKSEKADLKPNELKEIIENLNNNF